MFGRLKTVVLVTGIGILAANCLAQDPEPAGAEKTEVPKLQPNAAVSNSQDAQSLMDKVSLIIGHSTVSRLKQQGVELSEAKLVEGIQLALKDEEIGMTQEEIRNVMMAYQKVVEKRQIEKMTLLAKKNKAEGDTFLAENAKKENVKTMDNGVQYEVLEEGSGEQPQVSNRVRVHYHGTLPDGTVFDSSLHPLDGSDPEPAEFGVNQVVAGFSAALQAMKVGDKWKVAIPGEKAYGMRGKGKIGPNQTLIFEIHLLDIVK